MPHARSSAAFVRSPSPSGLASGRSPRGTSAARTSAPSALTASIPSSSRRASSRPNVASVSKTSCAGCAPRPLLEMSSQLLRLARRQLRIDLDLLLLVRPARRQRRLKLLVVTVNVVEEVHRAVFIRIGRQVGDAHRERSLQPNLLVVLRLSARSEE